MSIANILQNTNSSWNNIKCDDINTADISVNGTSLVEIEPIVFQSNNAEWAIDLTTSETTTITMYKINRTATVSFDPIQYLPSVGVSTDAKFSLLNPTIPTAFYPKNSDLTGTDFPILGQNEIEEDTLTGPIYVQWNPITNTFFLAFIDGFDFDENKSYQTGQITVSYLTES
jgi:hypothetical protein